eukprot:TRINITY_DN24893_c0_g1_i1.p1 TRINITY_DN24893_c0_g1~~TRINITY_DN24893_c0_g1_i1.p1  ORF type:complete len:433 (-),score=79.35 TRINITY_DN24893_c0_g1_i1:230-1528(-)
MKMRRRLPGATRKAAAILGALVLLQRRLCVVSAAAVATLSRPESTPGPCRGTEVVKGKKADVALVVRTYSGDILELEEMIKTMHMFVPQQMPLVIVLDAEKAEDIIYGYSLAARGFKVCFDPLPPTPFRRRENSAWPDHPSYGRVGYQRQQWSSFYLERYVDADVIGVVDADVRFYSLLSPSMIWDQSGKIIARGVVGEWFENNKVALNDSDANDKERVNFMIAEAFPMFYRRETFSLARAFIASNWGVPFDEAFRRFSKRPYSWQNILYQFALQHQPDAYTLRLNTNVNSPTLSCASHRNVDRSDILEGCCRCFNYSRKCSHVQHIAWKSLILRYADNHGETTWRRWANLSSQYYTDLLNGYLKDGLEGGEVQRMRSACRFHSQTLSVKVAIVALAGRQWMKVEKKEGGQEILRDDAAFEIAKKLRDDFAR